MKRLLQTILGCAGILSASAQTFTANNLVVLQTSGTASKAASAATLKEYTTAGVAGISVTIPTTGLTPFQTGGIYGGSEGFLSTSTDGKYLVLGGYATSTTPSDITGTTATSVPRAVGLVYPSGYYLQVDTSTVYYSANDIRGAVSDGTNFWASGASNNNIDGINYFGPGTKTALGVSSSPPKAYGMRIINGQLYFSSQKSMTGFSNYGIFALGTGTPTSGTPTITQVINTGGTTILPQDFSFNPAGDICYMAVNLNTAAGGVYKYTKTGGVWSLAYILGTGVTNIGAYGLVADYSGSVPVLYATTFESAGNRVIKIVDNGTLGTAVITTVVSAVANTFNKGISFAPVASGTPIVNLSINKDTASEAGVSVVTVTANTSAPVTGAQSVTLIVSGTGITAGDYSLSGTTIAIANGATSGSVTFTVVNDILGEGTEKATITMGGYTAGIVAGMRTTQRITITDNDGNNVPTITMDTATTNFIDAGVTVPPVTPFKLSGVINDPTDPGKTAGIKFKISDLESAATTLTVTVTSSNTTVVPLANIILTGTDSIRTLQITPSAIGYSNITVTVTDGIDPKSFVINYAASAASTTPASTVWHTGLSDGSDAAVLDDSYYIMGDDELNVLNVYSRTASGMPLQSYNYTAGLSLPEPAKPEVDVEASAKSPVSANKIYWLGSMSNGKSPFDNKPNRDRIFATTYTGTGAATTFTFSGYAALKTSLLAWGDARGYGFTASAAAGVDSKSPGGFAAEGMVFGPDNTTLYVGLRAPLVPTATRTKAVIAPILNFETWFNNGSPAGSPTYGAPIELELGGRGIRDIIRLSNGTYVIVAGSPAAAMTSAIYKWTGYATDAPIAVSSSASGILNMEGVMPVNTGGVLSLTSLQVITDQGDDEFYNDGTVAKDFNDLIYRKFRSDIVSSIDLTFPEINLQGNSNTVTNGDITPSTTDNTDFGSVNFNNTPANTLVIQNTGTATLTVSGITITGANAGDYSLVSAPLFPLSILPGGSQSISVQFAPLALGARNATLNIISNDADEATYSIAITGNGICNVLTAHTIGGGGTMCAGAVGYPVTLSSSTTGVNYQLYNGLNPVGSPLAGTGATLNFGLQTAAGTYTITGTDATTSCTRTMTGSVAIIVNPLPTAYAVTGGGSYCSGGTGISVGVSGSATGINYQLYRGSTAVGTAVAGNGSARTFGLQTVAGSYTAIATDATTTCSISLTSSAVVAIKPLPISYSVTGGGTYCTGGTGLNVGIAASNTDVNYVLYLGGVATAITLPGTGAPLDFGAQKVAGVYTVIGTDVTTTCVKTMSGSATIVANPQPAAFFVTGGGAYCEGSTGVSVGLTNSVTGIDYQLYNGATATGSAVAGTSAALDFGPQAAGTYTVKAINSVTGCSSTMNLNAIVTSNPLPAQYDVTGGGTYCTGGAGFNVGLNNSEIGFEYQLYNGATMSGASVTGDGTALDYGVQTAAGTYSVVATNPTTGCMNAMNGNAVIIIRSMLVPSVTLSTTPGTEICAGTSATYSAMEINGGTSPVYEWTVNDSVVSTTAGYTYVPVNGDVVKVTLTSNEMCATTPTAIDAVNMSVNAIQTASVSVIVAANDTVCNGTSVTLSATPSYGGGSPAFSWYVNGVKVSDDHVYSYMPANNDVIYSELVSNYRCLSTTVPARSKPLIMTVTDPMIPAVNIVSKSGNNIKGDHTDTLVATVSSAVNPKYAWYKNGIAIAGANAATLVRTDFANKDSITCMVTNGDACGLSTFNSIVLRVNTTGIANVNNDLDVMVLPNPNNGTFTVKGNTNTNDVTLQVKNMLGQVVYAATAKADNGALNTQIMLSSTLANGMYLLNVSAGAENKVFHVVVAK